MKENKIKEIWNNIDEKHPGLKGMIAKIGLGISASVFGGTIGYMVGAGKIRVGKNLTVSEAASELVDEIVDEVS